MRTDTILELGALALSRSLHEGEITVVDLMTATLDRIEAVNPTVNAIVSRADRSTLLQQAQDYDQQQSSRGWLHGIPLAVKDNTHVAGFSTTLGGSPLARRRGGGPGDYPIASETAPHIQRLLDAGAIVVGKTNIPESAVGCHSANPLFGVTCNPYQPNRSAGGSSGGAAAALAARMVCIADGTDMMGSLRNPAGWNNVVSLRPTARKSNGDGDGCCPSLQLLDYPISMPGPMARTVEDLTALYWTMFGSDDEKEGEGNKMDLESILVQSIATARTVRDKPWRIAWLGDWNGAYPMEEGILDLCHEALTEFAQSENIQLDNLADQPIYDAKDLWKSWTTIRSFVIAEQVQNDWNKQGNAPLESLNLKPELIWEIQQGNALSKEQIQQAQQIAQDYSNVLETFFETYDAIALPTAQMWALPVNITSFPMEIIPGQKLDSYHRWMEVAVPVSLAGLPCVAVPTAGPPTNRFMGIQLAGKRGSEDNLLALVKNWPIQTLPVPFSS